MKPERRGILLSQASCPTELEAEFDAWYEDEHIPKRLALDGFSSAARYHAEAQEAQRHLVVYQLSDLRVLDTPQYDQVKRGSGNTERTQRMLGSVSDFTRYIARLTDDSHPSASQDETSPFLFVVTFPVPDDRFDVFDEWYDADHLPILLAASGWDRCRRYRVESGDPIGPTAIVLHDLSNTGVLDGPERARARETAWRQRLVAEEPWFTQGTYALYRRR